MIYKRLDLTLQTVLKYRTEMFKADKKRYKGVELLTTMLKKMNEDNNYSSTSTSTVVKKEYESYLLRFCYIQLLSSLTFQH